MSVAAIKPSLSDSPLSAAGAGLPPSNGKSFPKVLAETKKSEAKPVQLDLFQEMNQMQKALQKNNQLSPRDLILYQIKAGQFNLRVELISKLSEGVLATLRKFQSNQ